MKATITPGELRGLLEGREVVLIDVLTPEDYSEMHIPCAQNACVYEMAFIERTLELAPKKDVLIVVYDASGTTRTAHTAALKLEQAGYRKVAILAGGLETWLEAGYPVERAESEKSSGATAHDGVHLIDVEKSTLEWTGRNINNRHYGRLALTGGEVYFRNGRLESGCFMFDMNTLSNLDLLDEGWRETLIRHLKSDDFFDVERYPTAEFSITGWEPIAGSAQGTPNGVVSGILTIKGTSLPVSFPAVVAAQADGTLKAQAACSIDRTLWDVCYGSGRLFERLGMHLVHDLISIELFMVTVSTDDLTG